MTDWINEAKVSPGSQNSNHIYKCIIQPLYGLNGLIGLAWEIIPFLPFSTEKVFSNLCIRQLNELVKTSFYVGTICAAVSLQLYIKCFYCKIELMYTNRTLCHNKVTSTYYLCVWWLFSLKLKFGIFILKIITDRYKYPNRKASKSPYIQHICEHLFQEFIYKTGIIPSVFWIAFPSRACASFSVSSFFFSSLTRGGTHTPCSGSVES